MIGPLELILAFFLDLAIGDPRWLPHPVRIIGSGISKMENFLRGHTSANAEKSAGVFLLIFIVVPVFVVTFLIQKAIFWSYLNLSMPVSMIVLIYLVSSTLALHELRDSAELVIESVKDGAVESARIKLSMIVGRDTVNLPPEGILRATIETLAENLSDGIVAPMFYLVIGGLPLAMAYKAVNTLDSMVGYKNKRYIHFGWASAKLDDIANYVPARITGVFIVMGSSIVLKSLYVLRRSMHIMLRDGRNHTSPNSGVPEAAMAGALGVGLGGPSQYGGIIIEKPGIGDSLTDDYTTASQYAVRIVSATSFLAVIIATLILSLRRLL